MVPFDRNQFNWKTGFIEGGGGRQEFETETRIRSLQFSNVGPRRSSFMQPVMGSLSVCVSFLNRLLQHE